MPIGCVSSDVCSSDLDPNARLVVSGEAREKKIERYWAAKDSPAMLQQLAALDIALITPPNYSVLTDVPRTDNLHAMKRILMATVEMRQAGLPSALHANARTERDFERWGELIAERPEIQYLAFEFATGAGRSEERRVGKRGVSPCRSRWSP